MPKNERCKASKISSFFSVFIGKNSVFRLVKPLKNCYDVEHQMKFNTHKKAPPMTQKSTLVNPPLSEGSGTSKRYAVALYVPFVIRVAGIEAASSAEAIEKARNFAQDEAWLNKPVMDGAVDWLSPKPVICYVEPHDPGEPIGALVDVADADGTGYDEDDPESDKYHCLMAHALYEGPKTLLPEEQTSDNL
jgi:hypothetical protein